METEADVSADTDRPWSGLKKELLRNDREAAVEYLKIAFERLETPAGYGEGLEALRCVGEAVGGLRKIAEEAGISREALYRALSPKGNPTFRTLRIVLKAAGLRLSVVDATRVAAAAKKDRLAGDQTAIDPPAAKKMQPAKKPSKLKRSSAAKRPGDRKAA